MTDDLVTWLRAQLDADKQLIDAYEQHMSEAAARAGSYVLVIPPGWHPGEPFDPDRQRAEVDAKRRILDAGNPTWEHGEVGDHIRFGTWESCSDECPGIVWFGVARLLAMPYANRPGYRDEWRPE